MGTPLKQNSLSGGLLPECRYTGSLFALIKGDVACVFARDPAARNTIEVLTTYPGVHAIIAYRIANRLWCRGWRYLPRLISFLARVWSGIDIHPGATIGARFFIDHGTGVVIGETAEVGDNVTLYHGVTLGGVSWSKGKRHPTLGNHVVVGAGAKILGPIRIGHFVRVGANSVVIRPVSDRNTVVGIPAKAVQSPDLGSQSEDDVNLNHHLIPDPVAEAVSCLLERIRILEQKLDAKNEAVEGRDSVEDCTHCDALDLCEPRSTQGIREE